MRRITYELGVNMRRQYRRRLAIRCAAVASVVLGIGILGFSFVPQYGASTQDELARRGQRIRSSGRATTIDDSTSGRSQWLRVERVQSSVPTAAPSVSVTTAISSEPTSAPATPPTAPIVPTMPVSPDVETTQPSPNQAPTSLPGPETAPQSTAVQPQAEVVTPAPAPTVVVTTLVSLPVITVPAPQATDLTNPVKKDIAMQLVSSAENSSLDWKAQYDYLEDIGDGRGYTGGIIGFTSGTHDMLELVRHYNQLKPNNPLTPYTAALQKVDGSDLHTGLGAGFEAAWKIAAADPVFRQAQDDERDRVYFNPAVEQAKKDGLRALGQFVYYDAMVMHGPGSDAESFGGIRAAALKKAKTPAQGGDEKTYLNAFLDARVAAMKQEAAHDDVSRVETAQRVWVQAGNFDLNTPLSWKTYGDSYKIQ